MKKLLLILLLLTGPAWASSNYENYVISNSAPTIFYYNTENSGTTIVNRGSAGANYNMTTSGSPALNSAGPNSFRGGSIGWTGASTQYANVNKDDSGAGPGDLTLGNARTIECWVKRTNVAGGTAFSSASSESADLASYAWYLTVNITPKAQWSIRDNASGDYQLLTGGTTLSFGTWYMVTATWTGATTTSVLYVNGVSDATSSTTAGTLHGAIQFWEQGRLITSTIGYWTGFSQDCLVIGSANTAPTVLARYNAGIAVSGGWPFITKAPRLPDYRNPGYLKKVVDRGYADGQLNIRAMEPLWLTVGWLPFSTLPPGNVR